MSSAKIAKKPSGRGDATRERLLAAALELFGRHGFDGVGAREIAAAAGVPLSAIPYHFVTKQALYRAMVAQVCQSLNSTMAPAIAAASAATQATRSEALAALTIFEGALLDVFAFNPAAESWAKVLLREHLDPGPAYDLVYQDAGRTAVELIAALIARATDRDQHDELVMLEAFARMGQILAFRTLQQAVLRRMDWASLGEREADLIKQALPPPTSSPPRPPLPTPR